LTLLRIGIDEFALLQLRKKRHSKYALLLESVKIGGSAETEGQLVESMQSLGEKFCGVDRITLQSSALFGGQRASSNRAYLPCSEQSKPSTRSQQIRLRWRKWISHRFLSYRSLPGSDEDATTLLRRIWYTKESASQLCAESHTFSAPKPASCATEQPHSAVSCVQRAHTISAHKLARCATTPGC
jgi:hypothetical protein